jgi:hypothetical protein
MRRENKKTKRVRRYFAFVWTNCIICDFDFWLEWGWSITNAPKNGRSADTVHVCCNCARSRPHAGDLHTEFELAKVSHLRPVVIRTGGRGPRRTK